MFKQSQITNIFHITINYVKNNVNEGIIFLLKLNETQEKELIYIFNWLNNNSPILEGPDYRNIIFTLSKNNHILLYQPIEINDIPPRPILRRSKKIISYNIDSLDFEDIRSMIIKLINIYQVNTDDYIINLISNNFISVHS
jgi:hypothetical protein